MHRSVSVFSFICLFTGCDGGTTPAAEPVAAAGGEQSELVSPDEAVLLTAGNSANFGTHALTSGFLPDPATVDVVSGGQLDASAANTGGVACAGWVTAQPDIIVNFDEMAGFLRFAFRPNTDGEDATLIINDGQGNWSCNDDTAGLNPVIDFVDAPAGHYDIWIGSYSPDAHIEGQLIITELADVMP